MIYMSMCDEHFIVPGTNKKKDQFKRNCEFDLNNKMNL